jgi:hypothetical protein
MIGPLLIFDQSFLQMLNPDEVFELSLLFHPGGTPLIVREIIADLRKDASSSGGASGHDRILKRGIEVVMCAAPVELTGPARDTGRRAFMNPVVRSGGLRSLGYN